MTEHSAEQMEGQHSLTTTHLLRWTDMHIYQESPCLKLCWQLYVLFQHMLAMFLLHNVCVLCDVTVRVSVLFLAVVDPSVFTLLSGDCASAFTAGNNKRRPGLALDKHI